MFSILPSGFDLGDDHLPVKAHHDDAGYDLRAAKNYTLYPGDRVLVSTATCVDLPEGTVGLVCPRSGLAVNHGLTIVNAPGVIDAGYKGELKVCILNTDRNNSHNIKRGDRIAQLVIVNLSKSVVHDEGVARVERGDKGFGSSGA